MFSFSLASVLNNRTTNEVKVGHVRESLLQGPSNLFDSNWKFIGFAGIDPFDVGSQNTHPDYIAGTAQHLRPGPDSRHHLRRHADVDRAGRTALRRACAWSRNGALPQGTAANFIGAVHVPDRSCRSTWPTRRPIPTASASAWVSSTSKQIDHRASGFISDKWSVSKKLTLNLGVRYDWQKATPKTKNAIGPRFGVAYDVLGDGKTLLRGGVGKVYQYQQLAILATLLQRAVIAPTLRLRHDAGRRRRSPPARSR